MKYSIYIVIAVVLIGAGAHNYHSMNHGYYTSPFYGRGGDLSKLPYCIITGTINPDKGVLGIMELGMTKTELRNTLGIPLVRALNQKESIDFLLNHPNDNETGDTIDPYSVRNDFYGGLFAWVDYDECYRVRSICFNLHAFNRKFKGHQKLLVSFGKSLFCLGSDTDLDDFVFMLKSKRIKVNLHNGDKYQLQLMTSNSMFVFDTNTRKLKYLLIKEY